METLCNHTGTPAGTNHGMRAGQVSIYIYQIEQGTWLKSRKEINVLYTYASLSLTVGVLRTLLTYHDFGFDTSHTSAGYSVCTSTVCQSSDCIVFIRGNAKYND
jgi:hypothetical protein